MWTGVIVGGMGRTAVSWRRAIDDMALEGAMTTHAQAACHRCCANAAQRSSTVVALQRRDVRHCSLRCWWPDCLRFLSVSRQ
jgi:hypothetical protein